MSASEGKERDEIRLKYRIMTMLAQWFPPSATITVELAKEGEFSGLGYRFHAAGAGQVRVRVPRDWLECVLEPGLARLDAESSRELLTLQALEISPPEGASRAWLVMTARTEASRAGVQFGQIGAAVEYGGRKFFHPDGAEMALERAMQETVRAMGLAEGPRQATFRRA